MIEIHFIHIYDSCICWTKSGASGYNQCPRTNDILVLVVYCIDMADFVEMTFPWYNTQREAMHIQLIIKLLKWKFPPNKWFPIWFWWKGSTSKNYLFLCILLWHESEDIQHCRFVIKNFMFYRKLLLFFCYYSNIPIFLEPLYSTIIREIPKC